MPVTPVLPGAGHLGPSMAPDSRHRTPAAAGRPTRPETAFRATGPGHRQQKKKPDDVGDEARDQQQQCRRPASRRRPRSRRLGIRPGAAASCRARQARRRPPAGRSRPRAADCRDAAAGGSASRRWPGRPRSSDRDLDDRHEEQGERPSAAPAGRRTARPRRGGAGRGVTACAASARGRPRDQLAHLRRRGAAHAPVGHPAQRLADDVAGSSCVSPSSRSTKVIGTSTTRQPGPDGPPGQVDLEAVALGGDVVQAERLAAPSPGRPGSPPVASRTGMPEQRAGRRCCRRD